MSHDVLWCHVMSCGVTWCHSVPRCRGVMFHDVMCCHGCHAVPWCHVMFHVMEHVTWCMSHDVMWCHFLFHDVILCRFMEDHATSSLIWNYKVVYRVLQTCSEIPSLCSMHRILSFTEVVCTMCRVFYWLASQPQTREELREALENEIRSFTVDKVSWRPPVLAPSRDLPTIEPLIA